MGWTFYDLASLPEIYDIVWCKWPQRENKGLPGEIVRPVLVRETRIMEQEDGTRYGAAVISYASGEGIDETSRRIDLCIETRQAFQAAGLHKPTRFSLNLADRKFLPWCREYFVPPEYVKNAGLILGRLTEAQKEALRERLTARGQIQS
jgi:hypothetical protein